MVRTAVTMTSWMAVIAGWFRDRKSSRECQPPTLLRRKPGSRCSSARISVFRSRLRASESARRNPKTGVLNAWMMSLRGLNRSSISDSGSRCCRGTGRGTLASRGDPGHCVLARERPPESGTCVAPGEILQDGPLLVLVDHEELTGDLVADDPHRNRLGVESTENRRV